MREEVVAPQVEAEYLWQKALSLGVVGAIRDNRIKLAHERFGRVVEYLGYAMVRELYPMDSYRVVSPQDMTLFRRLFTEEERKMWQFSIPDGLIFKKEDRFPGRVFELFGFAEYKATRWRNLTQLREQFDGFMRLVDFIKWGNEYRGRQILKELLGRNTDFLLVPKDIKFVYVSPSDESVDGIPTSLYGVEHLEKKPLPLSVAEIWERIHKVQKGE